jgi:DNA-directed RNA polymerase specialized sigma24 family protein
MAADEGVGEHVPYLRRFARALTGSQEVGDACVVKALETILAKGASDLPTRLALYKLVLSAVNAIDAVPTSGSVARRPEVDAVQRNLAALTPVGRQAFLLTTMEEFSPADAARVLGMSPAEVSDLVEEANQDLTAQIATDVVIIEDEPLIAMDLQALVRELGHRVIRVARTHREAVEAVEQSHPGLVLADIRLADGSSGLDAAIEILRTLSVPIIFITAFPELLLTGSRPEPTFLIRKPFTASALKAVISQALFFDIRARP